MSSAFRILMIVVVSTGLAACADRLVCAPVGFVVLSPQDTTVAIGASFFLRYQEGGSCYPDHPAESDFHSVHVSWQTTDTAIVQLDTATARVTARQLGDAIITNQERGLSVTVHVR
jgi:hypothetical protein